MSNNAKTEWNALGKLIGLALQVVALIGFVYAAIIAITLVTGF